jgi:serine phosphatase RsbU (regulator of sigma subunit)/pSer/pThr/pTyr-binding forkhead associated (FHA) protein
VASLVALDGELSGRRFPLESPCLVGRGPYNHVVLDDTRISRQHAKISPESGGHMVYDLNSANGTYVNDLQVKRQKLAPNDIVRFGPFSFKFEAEGLERTGPHKAQERKFVEVLTQVGAEPPVKILETLDAALSTNPGLVPLNELEDADRKLRTLYAFMQAISATLDLGELLERIVRNLLDIFPDAEVVTVYLRDASTGGMEPRRVAKRDQGPASASTLPGQFHEEVVLRGRAVLSTTISGLHRRKPVGGLSMHAPMLYQDVVHGVLHVRGSEGEAARFNQRDLDLLTGIAASAALALQNARMHQESLKQQRLQQDLLLAEQIQKSFLPRTLPAVEGIEFQTEYRPAYSVGGDFYDVFWISYDQIGVFIGDVSGKGVSAALLMARISSDLRLAAAAVNDPAKALEHVNRIVLERKQHDIFVTCIYLTLNIKTHAVTLANAGHLPPLIRRRGGKPIVVERLEGAGTAIGIFDDAEYEKVEFKLEPGDALVLCTDGVLEATSLGGEQFGGERLETCMARATGNAADITEQIQKALRAHVGEAPQYDDLTLIVCGITETPPERKKRRDEPTQNVPVQKK